MDHQVEITRDDYVQWRNDYVTQEFFRQIKLKMVSAGMFLAENRAVDYSEYRHWTGYYKACQEILNTEFESNVETTDPAGD